MKAQKDIIEKMAKDLKDLKKTQPNGELKRIEDCVNKLIRTLNSASYALLRESLSLRSFKLSYDGREQ